MWQMSDNRLRPSDGEKMLPLGAIVLPLGDEELIDMVGIDEVGTRLKQFKNRPLNVGRFCQHCEGESKFEPENFSR